MLMPKDLANINEMSQYKRQPESAFRIRSRRKWLNKTSSGFTDFATAGGAMAAVA
jgi:hypothetical protein